jgi:hypothetical protein
MVDSDLAAVTTPEPVNGLPGIPTTQMHHQVDRTSATMAIMPVEEFRAGDTQRAAASLPP